MRFRLISFAWIAALGLVWLAAGPVSSAQSASAPSAAATIYLPLVMKPGSRGIVIDHRTANLAAIPAYWIGEARKLTFHFAHTSHGSQINTGIEKLAQLDPQYDVHIQYGGATVGLPPSGNAFRMYDGNNYGSNTYITPDMYWDGAAGMDQTRAVASTGLFGYSMWSWCGQQSSNDVATVQRYLDNLNTLESQYPNMRFIYMTGHTDGGSTTLASQQPDGAGLRRRQPEGAVRFCRPGKLRPGRDVLPQRLGCLHLVLELVQRPPIRLPEPGA